MQPAIFRHAILQSSGCFGPYGGSYIPEACYLHPRLNAIILHLHTAGARCGIGF